MLRIEHVARFDYLGSFTRQAVLSSVQQEGGAFAGELGGCADGSFPLSVDTDLRRQSSGYLSSSRSRLGSAG
ncbi:hypothetical protein ACWEPL_26565 [Nonomuraea sp. NPDC004186]